MRWLVRALAAGSLVAPIVTIAALSAAPSARAENNGVGQTPAMGWSIDLDWSMRNKKHVGLARLISAE